MATTAQKQDWLISQGKPKSYSYFMTGPNLGPDWDWDKAISGGYAPHEIDGFVTTGEAKYKAHKKTSGKKKAAGDPGNPVTGPSTSCAKTAAKSIGTWVAQAKIIADSWYNTVGAEVYAKGYATGKNTDSFVSELKAQIKLAVAEVGDQADEVIAMRQLVDIIEQVQASDHTAVLFADLYNQLSENDITNAVTTFSNLNQMVKAAKVTLDGEKAAALFGDIWTAPMGVLDEVMTKARTFAIERQQGAVGMVFRKLEAQGALPDSVPFLQGSTSVEAFEILTDHIEKLSFTPEFLTAEDLLESAASRLNELNYIAGAWTDFMQDTNLGFSSTEALDLMGDLGKQIRTIAGSDILQDVEGLLGEIMVNEDWWLGGGTLAGSPIEKLAQKYGSDAVAGLLGEVEQVQKAYKNAGYAGLFDEAIAEAFSDNIGTAAQLAQKAAEDAIDTAKSLLPGFTPTKAEVLAKLDEAVVAVVTESNTDDLNALVQVALEEKHGQPKTLTYFMTKEQKVDLILLPKETFDATEYVVKYKGVTITGNGLETSTAKYAVKNGTKTLDEIATGAVTKTVDDVAVTDVKIFLDPVDALKKPPPAGSPAWWADPATDKQKAYSTKLAVETNSSDPWMKVVEPLYVDEALTKGQMHYVISVLEEAKDAGEKASLESLTAALQYSTVEAKATVEVADVVADAAEKAIKAEAVTTTKVATAAPDLPNWDEKHTFTYQGDGQGKWGGAHRKWHFTDENGDDWMLKNGDAFRLEGELAAHRIGHLAGFDVAEARVTTQTVAGKRTKGFMQRMFRKSEISGELGDITGLQGGSLVGVDDDILRQLQEHQVLDWLTGNHDGHAQNFLIMNDGRVIGIDKGQAFKFLGKDTLSADYTPNGNFGEIAYNRMWREYREGKLALDLDVIDDALRRIEAIPDAEYAATVRTYAEGRFAAPSSKAYLQGTSASSVDEFVELALERKRNIRAEFNAFYQENARVRGVKWVPKPTEAKVSQSVKQAKKVVKNGEALTPITEDFTAGVLRAGAQGKPIYIAGSDIERGQVLFDVAVDSKGNQVLRVNLTMLPDGDRKVMKVFAEEGGEALTKSSGAAGGGYIPPTTPKTVVAAQEVHNTAIQAAKTINYHIGQGDFAYNQSSISSAQAAFTTAQESVKTLSKEFGTIVDAIPESKIDEIVDAALARAAKLTGFDDQVEVWVTGEIERLAESATQLKTAQVFEPHLSEIVTEAAKGNAAAKVDMVPSFNAIQHYEGLRDDAMKTARARLDAITLEQHVEVAPPKTIFKKVFRDEHQTYQISTAKGAGPEGRWGVLQTDGPSPIVGQSSSLVRAQTEDGVDVLYREINNNYATHQGWMEMAIHTDGEITAKDIERAHQLLHEMGVQADLATPEDMELTYWRVVNATYRNSKDANVTSSKYYKALQEADANVRSLGANPTAAEEVEAIKSAYRTQFGSVVDDADYLPIHDHALAGHAEEIGWGYFERPEIGADELVQLQGKIVYHSTRYGDGVMREELFHGATGDGLMAQVRRQEMGFAADAASASSDLGSGGAAGFFTRLADTRTGVGNDAVIMSPARVHRKLGNYNTTGDSYGRLSNRSSANQLTADGWAAQGRTTNETMIRDQVSWMDDVEIALFSNPDNRNAALSTLRARGVTHIRGVPIEDRFVYVANPTQYVEKHFLTNVGKAGFRERLRRSVDDIVGAVKKKASDAADWGKVVSRLKTKTGKGGVRVMAKKLSTGRTESFAIQTPQAGYVRFGARFHDVEDAISLPVKDLASGFGFVEEDLTVEVLTDLIKNAGIKNWSYTEQMAFKRGRYPYDSSAVTFDLAEFGIEIKNFSKYQKQTVLRDFTEAFHKGTMKEFAEKYGFSLAT